QDARYSGRLCRSPARNRRQAPSAKGQEMNPLSWCIALAVAAACSARGAAARQASDPSAGAAPDVARARGEQRHRLREVLLEMHRLLMRLEGLLVGVDLVQHDLRAIVRIDQHVELLAAGLLARVLRVFK